MSTELKNSVHQSRRYTLFGEKFGVVQKIKTICMDLMLPLTGFNTTKQQKIKFGIDLTWHNSK